MSDEAKINILLVDDKPEKVLALEAALEDLGQTFVRAYSGREALRCLLHGEFAVILLDVNMPGMDGFETASLIRQRPATRDVPIIFVTAMDDETHASRGYSLGAVDYIQTPVVADVLRTKVSVFVDLYRKTDQIRRQAEGLRHRAAQLHKLTSASLAVNSALSIEKMFEVVAHTARDITGANWARAVLVFDFDWSRATAVCAPSQPIQDKRCGPSGSGLHVLVCRLNKPIHMNRRELDEHSAWYQQPNTAPQGDTGGWLAVPLSGRDGRNLGLLEVADKTAGDFTEDDKEVLVQLSQMASIAVENTLFAAERETNRIKDEFLSTLSHELRTPLNAILGWTQLLKMEKVSDDVAHGLTVIDRNVRAQSKLIEDLLDISRITSGKLRLSRRAMAVGPIVQAAADSVRPVVEAKHIDVDCVLDSGNIVLDADPDRLQQVFWNLFSNAAKFTPENGRITVRLRQVDHSVQLQVSDTGQGIAPAFLPHVFDRFRQADSSSTRNQGGLGIGLTIVRHIVELHGGWVKAESAGEGKGATFIVTLPINAAKLAAAEAQRPDSETTDTDLEGLTILLVDDEADTREVVAKTLRNAHASVVEAGSVGEALSAFDKFHPAIVISDIAMPGEDGYDLIDALKKRPNENGNKILAAALTAYASDDDRAKILSAGFQFHIPKPVEPVQLIAFVSQMAKSSATHMAAP